MSQELLPTLVPPPWQLSGQGYIFLFRIKQSWAEQNAFLADYQRETHCLGLGAMMLVDYQTSGVGPYHELLFIPALFRIKNQYVFSISKIYVSSEQSVVNGRHHWGIPKELAQFTVSSPDPTQEKWEVALPSGEVFFSVNLRKHSFTLPISTSLLPLRVIQQKPHGFTLTRPSAKGRACRVTPSRWGIHPDYFPNAAELPLISALHISSLSMVFPEGIQL
jgi:hypothetical protein